MYKAEFGPGCSMVSKLGGLCWSLPDSEGAPKDLRQNPQKIKCHRRPQTGCEKRDKN